MAAGRLVEQLNKQVGHEFAAAQQYVANALFYDARTLPRLANFFYAQALEERNHALMMVRCLLDSGAIPAIRGVAAPVATFDDLVAPVVVALEQEKFSKNRPKRSRRCQTCSRWHAATPRAQRTLRTTSPETTQGPNRQTRPPHP